jgi:hypothetical protein
MKNLKSRIRPQSIFSIVICLLLLLTFSVVAVIAQEPEQRLINKVQKYIPLKIEIVHGDINSKIEDIKIKITNTSEKPVYFLHFDISTLDNSAGGIKSLSGGGYSLKSFSYGDMKFGRKSKLKEESDEVFLKKGDHVTFDISKVLADAFVRMLNENGVDAHYRLFIIFQWLSYGDGTGFMGSNAIPYPVKNKQTSLIPSIPKSFFLTSF